MTLPGFRELTDSEAEELRPFMLDGRDLSAADVDAMREAFGTTMQNALRATADGLGRAPTEEETDILARAVARYLNENLAPLLHQRATGLN